MKPNLLALFAISWIAAAPALASESEVYSPYADINYPDKVLFEMACTAATMRAPSTRNRWRGRKTTCGF